MEKDELAMFFASPISPCIYKTDYIKTAAQGLKRNELFSTDNKKILLVRQNLPKNKQFLARQFYTLYEQKFSNMRPLLSITFPQGF